MMSERDFWDLLDVMRGEVDHDAVDRLRDALTALSRKAVIAFQHRLADRLYVRAGRGSQRQPGRCTWATCSPLRPTFAPGEDRNLVDEQVNRHRDQLRPTFAPGEDRNVDVVVAMPMSVPAAAPDVRAGTRLPGCTGSQV
jgi:hypothetical protein